MNISLKKVNLLGIVLKRIIEITIFLLPLFVLTTPGPYVGIGAIKVYIFEGLTLTAFLLWTYLRVIIKDERYRYKFGIIDWIFIAFLGWIILSAIFGASPVTSFWSYYMRGVGVIFYIHLYLFFILIRSVFPSIENFRRLLVLVGATGFLMALQTYVGTSGLGIKSLEIAADTSGATLGNSSFLGGYLIIALLASLYLLFTTSSKARRIFYGVTSIVIVVSPTLFNFNIWLGKVSIGDILHQPTLFLGEARAAVLGMLIGVIAAGIWFIFVKGKKWVRYSIVVVMLVAIVLSSVGIVKTFQTNTALNKYFIETTGGNRLAYAKVSLQAMHDRPLFGFGPENYFIAFEKYFDTALFSSPLIEPWVDKPHNQVLEWGAVAGIPALLLYLCLFFVPLVVLVRYSWKLRQASLPVLFGIAALIAYFFQNLFLFDTPATAVVWVIVLACIYAAIYIQTQDTPEQTLGEKDVILPAKQIALSVGIKLLYAGVLIWMVILPIAKLHALSKLVIADPVTRADRLEYVTHMSPVGVSRTTAQFADALYQSYANNFSIIMSAEDGEKRASYDLKSQVKVLQSIEAKDPDNYQNPFVIARINNLIYELSKAKDTEANSLAEVYGKKLLVLSPSNVFGYLTLAETYVAASKFNEAIDLVKQAIVLQPTVSETRSLLLNLYLISNQDDLFNAALVKAQNEIPGFVYTIPF